MVIVQIITDCSVFDRFCFQCIVCLFYSFYGLYCSIYIVEMLWYSRNCVETIINLVFDSTKVKWFALYHTNLSHEVPLSFVWLKFSDFGWDIDMVRIRSENTLSLGMPKATQGNIHGITKQLSLGIPWKASPLSSSTLSATSLGAMFSFVTWYEFYLERHFILLGFACCYLE